MTPNCSTCGYVVEWLRSSYLSNWYLFLGDPETATPGRYIFAPSDRPHYPGLHNFGSRIWTTGDIVEQPALGEDIATRHQWFNGMTPDPFPSARLIGREDCIQYGEVTPPAELPERTFVNGWDIACFLPSDPTPAPEHTLLDISNRAHQTEMARVVSDAYSNLTTAAARMTAFFGTGATTFKMHDMSGKYPATLVCQTPSQLICIVTGTTSFEQLATQFLYTLEGYDFGGVYSTNFQWSAGEAVISAYIAASGFNLDLPLILVGHSYGGAIALNLAARAKFFDPERVISCLTYGCPKPGDRRMENILERVPSVRIANRGDPVPGLPPSGQDLIDVLDLLGVDLGIQWGEAPSNRQQWVLEVNGLLFQSDAQISGVSALRSIAANVAADLALPTYFPHSIDAYVTRLALAPF